MRIDFVGDDDRVLVKYLWKSPVPIVGEVKLLFDLLPDFSPVKIALGFILFQGLRPCEVPRMTWRRLEWDENKERIVRMTHLVYKPSRGASKKGFSFMFKEVRKPFFSQWLSEQLKGYAKKYPVFDSGRIFPFNTSDSVHKWLSNARKSRRLKLLSESYDFLLDENIKTIKGEELTKFRVCLYAFRRFSFTFHYYVTFSGDAVALAKNFGHSRVETTLTHYVQPKESIGLTDAMIKQGVSFDEFLSIGSGNQKNIIDFVPEWKERFTVAGQKLLNEYF